MTINTTYHHFPVPDENTTNDYPLHMQQLGAAIDAEMSLQGTLEDRPPAGAPGRLYWATTSGGALYACLFRDDGTKWRPISQSGWVAWNPAISAETGSAYTATVGAVEHSEWQLDGDKCFISYAASIGLAGGPNPDGGHGLTFQLPFSAHNLQATMSADVQNGPGRCLIGPAKDTLSVLPGNSAWVTNGVATNVRFDGWYRVLVSPFA